MENEALHEAARALMDANSKPEWKKLSLEEWIVEYGEQISDEVRDEAYELLDEFFDY